MASGEHKTSNRRYRFDDLTLDLGRRALWRDGEQVRLSNLTFELLHVLVEQAPHVVADEELADRTWGSKRIVTPENLAKRVMLLRQALGDSVEEPRYIERVRGQGYRLIPDVEQITPHDSAAPEASPAAAPLVVDPGSRRRIPVGWIAAAVAVAVLLAGTTAWLTVESLRGPAKQRQQAIAVLPFENRSVAEEDAGFFAEGIHDDLITRLATIRDLKVTPRASVMDYRGQTVSPRTIAEELGVQVVLDGSVQRAGDKVRVNVHLIDARTDETIWGKSYDEELTAENVFSIQREIATAIAKELEAKLTPEEASQLSQAPTQNMRALDLYMSGRDYERPPFAYWGMAALQYERAVEEDPGFALAHARLSLASLLAYYNIDGERKRVETAKKAADEAVRLQPDLAIARVAKAFYLISEAGELDRAQDELRAAGPEAQDEPQYFIVRALINERLGNRDEAAADRAAALALNPRDPTLMLDIAIWHSRVREHDEAKRLVDRALDIRPDFAGAALFRGELALFRDGDPAFVEQLSAEAFDDDPGRRAQLRELKWLAALYERDFDGAVHTLEQSIGAETRDEDGSAAEQRQAENVPYLLSMATTLRLAGDIPAARALYEKGLKRIPDDSAPWLMWRAAFLAGCGHSEEAVSIGRRLLMESDPEGPFTNMLRLWLVLEVFAPAGARALVVETLDEYLARPGSWSMEGLAPDPRFDLVRDDPGFEALLAKHGRPGVRAR